MDRDDLTPGERAELERVRGALADPAVWAEPSFDLQERVVAAVLADADAEPGAGTLRRRRPWVRYAVGAAAAAVLLVTGVAVGLQVNRDHTVQFAAAMTATGLAPDATGDVTLTKTPSGWRIRLHATGLPRRAGGEFYEAWLKDDAGVLVPIGTFNDGHDVTMWSGVGPADYPTLTITREVADGNQASSGQVVLLAKPHRS